MAKIQPRRSQRALPAFKTSVAPLPLEQIMAVKSQSPLATGIEAAGNVISQAIRRRNELRGQKKQSDLMSKAFESGDLSGLSPENQIAVMKIKASNNPSDEFRPAGNGVIYNPRTGEFRTAPAPAGNIPTDEIKKGNLDMRKVSEGSKLRQQFIAASKPFSEISQAYNRIQSAVKTPTPAGDLSLIYNYMKILDPTSVVRESEFAQAAKTGAYGERVKSYVNSIVNGKRLSDEIRNDFVFQANNLYNGQKNLHKQREEQFSGIARNIGIDPRNVVFKIGNVDATEKGSEKETPANENGANGSGVVTKEVALSLMKEAGGDKEKARALAKSRGLRF